MNDGYLAHHGIKGMKWGVRRYRNYDGTLTDAGRKRYSLNRVDLVQRPLSNFPTAVLARKVSKKSAEHQLNSFDYDIEDKEGNKLGHLYLYKESPSSLNINWIDIKQKHRGQKYAQEVLNGVIDEARKRGYKQITLEVPDEDDSALHIYKKLGFKKTRGKISEILNPMVLNLDQQKTFAPDESNDGYLAHHGVKGMKWGVRRYRNYDGTLTHLGKLHYENRDSHISPGKKLYRVSTKEREKNSGFTYMTPSEADHKLYSKEAQCGIYDRETGELCTDIFSTEYKVTRDILIPSFNKSMEAFIATTKDIPIKDLQREVSDQNRIVSDEFNKDFIYNFSNLSVKRCQEDAYITFSSSLAWSEKNRKIFFDELGRQGYSAVWDENDRGANKFTKKPFILFEKDGYVEQTKSKRYKE